MDKIRTANEATGGLTAVEWDRLKKHYAIWVKRASRTTPVDREAIQYLIRDLYSAAALSEPIVEVVSSPGAMAFTGTFARCLLDSMMRDKHYAFVLPQPSSIQCDIKFQPIVKEVINSLSNIVAGAKGFLYDPDNSDVYHPTLYATYALVDAPTADAMDGQTNRDIRQGLDHNPLRDMENAIIDAMKEPFGNSTMTELIRTHVDEWGFELARAIFPNEKDASSAINGVCDWWIFSQRGAADSYWDFCMSATRDVVGLNIPGHDKYRIWEECTINCAYRYMHAAFCLVSEFPTKIVSKNLNYVDGSGQNFYYWNDGWYV